MSKLKKSWSSNRAPFFIKPPLLKVITYLYTYIIAKYKINLNTFINWNMYTKVNYVNFIFILVLNLYYSFTILLVIYFICSIYKVPLRIISNKAYTKYIYTFIILLFIIYS